LKLLEGEGLFANLVPIHCLYPNYLSNQHNKPYPAFKTFPFTNLIQSHYI